MTTSKEFAIDNIISLSDPGGEGVFKSQTSSDPLRPLVHLKIIEGFNLDFVGPITLEVEGLSLNPSNTVFQSNCFTVGCFEQSGIWTQALETEETRNISGFDEWFIPGDVDDSGAIYIIDVGYIYSGANEQVIVEENIPVYADLVVRTTASLPSSIKYAVLKRVTPFSLTIIDYAYGEFRTGNFLPRTSGGSLLEFTANSQQIELEDLSISLLLFFSTNIFKIKNNQIVYRPQQALEPFVDSLINHTVIKLVQLIDRTDSNQGQRKGTIPKYLATYLESASNYDISADEKYINPFLGCYEDECFDDTSGPNGGPCYTEIQNETLISREVSNRALAWFVIMLSNYVELYNQYNWLKHITIILDYLKRQLNTNSQFYYFGWTDSQQYNNSERIETLDSSTNIMICLAFIKGYEITNDFEYIQRACTLFENIDREFQDKDNLYVNNLDNEDVTIESTVYQLLFYNVFDEYKNIFAVQSYLESRISSLEIPQQEVITDSLLVPVTTTSSEVITTSGETAEVLDLLDTSIFFLTNSEIPIATDNYIAKINYLGISSIKAINTKLAIFNIEEIEAKLLAVFNQTADIRNLITLVFSAAELVDNQSIFQLPSTKLTSIKEVKNLQFQKLKVLDVMKRLTPINFGWFNEKSLTKQGVLGQLYNSVALPVASLYTRLESVKAKANLIDLYGLNLNRKGEEVGIVRFSRESRADYIERISNRIRRRANTKIGIQKSLEEFNTLIEVLEPYNLMATTEVPEEQVGQPKLGHSYYSGNELASPNIVQINVTGPLEADAHKRILEVVSAGVKYKIREVVTFTTRQESNIDLRVIEVSEGCPALTGNNNDDFIQESGFRICLEDAPLI